MGECTASCTDKSDMRFSHEQELRPSFRQEGSCTLASSEHLCSVSNPDYCLSVNCFSCENHRDVFVGSFNPGEVDQQDLGRCANYISACNLHGKEWSSADSPCILGTLSMMK